MDNICSSSLKIKGTARSGLFLQGPWKTGKRDYIGESNMKNARITYIKSLNEIPRFKTIEEEAEFWDTHSIAKVWNQLEEAKIEVSDSLKQKMLQRRKAKKLISLRLEQDQIQSLKNVASKKGIGYLTMIRMWVNEKLSKEQKYIHAQH